MTGFKRIRSQKDRRPGRAAASENFIAASQDAHPDDGGDGRELCGQCIIHGTGGVQHGVGMFSMFRPAFVVSAVIWLIMPGSFLWMMQMRLPPARG